MEKANLDMPFTMAKNVITFGSVPISEIPRVFLRNINDMISWALTTIAVAARYDHIIMIKVLSHGLLYEFV